jgi:hypothetical protein
MNPGGKSRRKPSREHRPSKVRCSLPEPVERRTRSTLPFPHEPGRLAGFVYLWELRRREGEERSAGGGVFAEAGGGSGLAEEAGDRDEGQNVR